MAAWPLPSCPPPLPWRPARPDQPCPQMAVLEIQANGDTRVTEEAIARARHSLSDPNMRVSSAPAPSGGTGARLGQAWGSGGSGLPRDPPTRKAYLSGC